MPRCYVFGSHVVHASIIARLRNWDEVGDIWAYAGWKGRLQYGGQVSHPRLFKLQNSYTRFVTCFLTCYCRGSRTFSSPCSLPALNASEPIVNSKQASVTRSEVLVYDQHNFSLS